MDYKSSQFLIERIKMYLMMIIGVFACFFFLVESEVKWLDNRKEGYCRPENTVAYPMIPYLPSSTHEDVDSRLFNFVEDYIHWTYNEKIVDFHRPSSLSRRATAYLQEPLQKSVLYSKGTAKAENMRKYTNSQSTYIRLKKCNCGFLFNINAIESIIKSKYTDIFHVTVLGEFQLTGDRQYNNENHSLWGFKRIWLTIVMDRSETNSKGDTVNPDGFYVSYQQVEDVDYYKKDLLMEKIKRKGFLIE